MDPSAERDFTAFYDATWRRTVAVTYAMTGDLATAEDLAQEAYSRAWPRWSSLGSYDDPGAWVRQVASRLAVSRWRRTKTALNFLARSRDPEPAAAPDETSVVLVEALRTLPEAQRRALVLHHLGELPVAEVARIEGCPEGRVGRADGAPLPAAPCLPGAPPSDAGGSGLSGNGTRSYEIGGYTEPGPEAAEWITQAVAQLRACEVAPMTETALADGVTLFTFELDQKNGHGAIWLAANEDRNVIYSVHGAATPLPDGVGEKVGQALLRELNVPWGPAQ